jgi:integrase/recombinase XerD
MREGQAKVLSETEFRRVVTIVKKKAHSKRNIALLYCSFGFGLRAKEMASLNVHHVLGVDDSLLKEINLDSSMTKGKTQRHVFLTNPKVITAFQDYLDHRKISKEFYSILNHHCFVHKRGICFHRTVCNSFSIECTLMSDCREHPAIVDANHLLPR